MSDVIAEDYQHITQGQVVLVLVGLIASGKSTFAQALEEHLPRFKRCNQDDLGNRFAVERLARRSLKQGLSVCIDRTNFDETQRAHWIKIAQEFPGTAIWCLVFDTPSHICEARLQTRTNHPTITSPEQGLEVLRRFASDFRAPSAYEGFDRVLFLKPSDHRSPLYTKENIICTLQQIRNASIPATPAHGLSDAATRRPFARLNYPRRGPFQHRTPHEANRGDDVNRGRHSGPSLQSSNPTGLEPQGHRGGQFGRWRGNRGQSRDAGHIRRPRGFPRNEFRGTSSDPTLDIVGRDGGASQDLTLLP